MKFSEATVFLASME